MTRHQKGLSSILVIGLVILVLTIVGSTGYFLLNKNKKVACTKEAKICSDGSSVGRISPNCEFAICPGNVNKEIGPSVVWDSLQLGEWQKCQSIDCISSVMKQNGASTDAINFTTNFKVLEGEYSYGNYGYLEKFQEMGKIDLGTIMYPDRANTNEEYCLLNGSPSVVSTAINKDDFESLINQDPLYPEMKKKYPDIDIWPLAPLFLEKNGLSNSGEEFVFKYYLINGCHACQTEYFSNIGFDFNVNGKFLKTVFLQITKEKTGI